MLIKVAVVRSYSDECPWSLIENERGLCDIGQSSPGIIADRHIHVEDGFLQARFKDIYKMGSMSSP